MVRPIHITRSFVSKSGQKDVLYPSVCKRFRRLFLHRDFVSACDFEARATDATALARKPNSDPGTHKHGLLAQRLPIAACDLRTPPPTRPHPVTTFLESRLLGILGRPMAIEPGRASRGLQTNQFHEYRKENNTKESNGKKITGCFGLLLQFYAL